MNDKNVKLETETCGINASIIITNNRDDSEKYRDYYCSIEIIVPPQFVLPFTSIQSKGNNITTVRAGPMDVDSMEFGLDFGPNEFRIEGHHVVARLKNVTAKNFRYAVNRGGLLAEDFLVTESAVMESVSADMVVSTSQRTSVRWWQRSGNLACLSAPLGSIYVDDSCEYICKYRDTNVRRAAEEMLRTRAHGNSTDTDMMILKDLEDDDQNGTEASMTVFREAREYIRRSKQHNNGQNPSTWYDDSGGAYTRQTSVLPWLCNGDPKSNLIWNCSKYDPVLATKEDLCPVGAAYKKKSQVPQVTGCTNLETCYLDESPKCLCKPTCDMSADLTPPGMCNDIGRCCQTICAGYSKADLFPIENQPRCGRIIDPIGKPWCNGSLDQQFTMTSDTGQLAVQVTKIVLYVMCVNV